MTPFAWTTHWNRRLPGLAIALALALAALLLLGRAVGAAAATGSPSAPRQPAVTFVVTATADSDDNNLNDGQCHDQFNGGCSLRAAVQQLDHDAGGTITLPAGTFNLTNNSSGDLQLLKNITINGVIGTMIQGNPSGWAHRLLRVQNGAQVIVNTVILSGGHAASANGGGINVVSGSLKLTSVTVSHNSAVEGGGIYNSGQLTTTFALLSNNQSDNDGGGLYNGVGATGELEATGVTSNTTGGFGGGVLNRGSLSIDASVVRFNTAGVLHAQAGAGGGVANLISGTLAMAYSTINNNTVFGPAGGGLTNQGTQARTTMVNSTVDGNHDQSAAVSLSAAASLNAAVSLSGPQGALDVVGGGIANVAGWVDLSNVTVTSNTIVGFSSGGGIFGNSPVATTTVRNTLVALNTALGGVGPDCGGTLDSAGYNLLQQTAGCAISGTTTGNITGLDPKLTPLNNWGGLNQTRAPLSGSPVIDKGNPSGCRDSQGNLISLDERGYPRPNGPFCDIGAQEGVSTLTHRLLLPLLAR